jgi:HAD superfamily hydrolase (TIGR01509 family)
MGSAIKGVLLDIDGTLVDSNDAHARAWVDCLAERGTPVPFEEVRRLIGMGGEKVLPLLTGVEKETPEGKAISARRKEIFRTRYVPHLKPTPGARDLLQHMKAVGLRLVIATSAGQDELGPLLKVCGADEIVDARTTSDDAEHSKPDPDIVEAALAELGLPADQAVMLGDTPYDVEAATRAGVPTIALRSGGWRDKDLAGARAIYDHPADLLARFDTSPLAAGTRR